jgi:hypothetical protein
MQKFKDNRRLSLKSILKTWIWVLSESVRGLKNKSLLEIGRGHALMKEDLIGGFLYDVRKWRIGKRNVHKLVYSY